MIYNINARYSAKNNCCIYRIGRWHVLYNFKWYFNLSDIFGHFIQNHRRTLWIDHAFTQAMHINQRNTHRWKCIWFYIKWINIVFTINLSKSKKNRFYFAFKASDLLKKKIPSTYLCYTCFIILYTLTIIYVQKKILRTYVYTSCIIKYI